MADLDALGRSLVLLANERLAEADAQLAARYPGDRADRQPLHTVYVPADRLTEHTPQEWGSTALSLVEQLLPGPAVVAEITGMAPELAEEVYPRMVAKLHREPIEDLRVDFEDGYGAPGDAAEDAAVDHAVTVLDGWGRDGPPWSGIRCKSLEAPTRDRGIATLVRFVAGSCPGRVPKRLRLTLPKVTSVDQVNTMAAICGRLEEALDLPPGGLGFEIQVETPQAILAADGSAAVAPMVHAAEGRCTGLHYGTYDYSAGLGIMAAYQSLEHPAADHAKAIMQLAAAQTGVWCSDGSTNVVAFDDGEQAAATWALHYRLVTRSLVRGYYQGWDLHPGHLPTRYLACYAFYRQALPIAAGRLRAYLDRRSGGVLDEPATARMLARAVARGLQCGAVDADEVELLAGAPVEQLVALAR